MKKFAKIFAVAFVLVFVAAMFTVFATAADEPDLVIYVSTKNGFPASDETAGLMPTHPLGHDADYADALAADIASWASSGALSPNPSRKKHAFRNACVKAENAALDAPDKTNFNVTIVIMDECRWDTGAAFASSGSAYEWQVTNSTGTEPKAPNLTITVTSNYGGVDYRKTGAKIILDRTQYGTFNFFICNKTIWKDIVFDYEYTEAGLLSTESWWPDYGLQFFGQTTVIESSVVVNSVEIVAGARLDGTRYPTLIAGQRYKDVAQADLTINGGTWGRVYCGGLSNNSGEEAKVGGDSKIVVNGGKITEGIYGGINSRPRTYIAGNLSITVNGGEVNEIIPYGGGGVDGDVAVTINKGSKVNSVRICDDEESIFAGDHMSEGKNVTLTYDTSAIDAANIYNDTDSSFFPKFTSITPPIPEKKHEETTPATQAATQEATKAATQEATQAATTKKADATKSPESTKASSTEPAEDEGIPFWIWIIVAVVVVAVIVVILVFTVFKKKK